MPLTEKAEADEQGREANRLSEHVTFGKHITRM